MPVAKLAVQPPCGCVFFGHLTAAATPRTIQPRGGRSLRSITGAYGVEFPAGETDMNRLCLRRVLVVLAVVLIGELGSANLQAQPGASKPLEFTGRLDAVQSVEL